MKEEDFRIHDILIIGAGPCGLAVAARLHEHTSSALFTDAEHQRFHWLKSSLSSRLITKPIRVSRRSRTARDRLLYGPSIPSIGSLDIGVLDANHDDWMAAWNEKFDKLGIGHLRSPMYFHPDPRDSGGLRAFTWAEGSMDELKEIGEVVGKDFSEEAKYEEQERLLRF
jgi:glycine/D-amino acid oxidase-like deaminating enzyme